MKEQTSIVRKNTVSGAELMHGYREHGKQSSYKSVQGGPAFLELDVKPVCKEYANPGFSGFSVFRTVIVMMALSLFYVNIFSQNMPFITSPERDQHNNIRIYLEDKAEEISNNSLNDVNSLDDWESVRGNRYNEFMETLGLTGFLTRERPELNVTVTGVVKMKGYRIEKLYYESLPSLYVVANLYIPDNIKKPRPAILYLCGHVQSQKVGYQAYAHKFAQLGFVCLIVETIHQGEVVGEHHGCYARGWFNWYSKGYTPAGVEVWNAIRGLDLLSSREEVDKERLGVAGRSGGGAQTWMVAAADKRVRVAVPSVGATTLNEQILTRTIDWHCDCMQPINTYSRDFQEIGALIAPRVLLIDQGDMDRLTNIEGVRKLYADIKKIYGFYGKPENIGLLEVDGGHGSTEVSRKAMFSFFLRELMNKQLSDDKIGDADFSDEAMLSDEQLKVYVNGAPADDITKTIQDSFIELPLAPEINSRTELNLYRDTVINFLETHTFGAFPKKPSPLAPHMVFRSMDKDKFGSNIYSFVPEEGWRLRMDVRWKLETSEKDKPLLIVLRNRGDENEEAEKFAETLGENYNIAYLNLRGIDQSGWEPGLQWHVRRAAAWTGRTIASMQVYDLLRSLEFCRSIQGVDPNQISIAAREDMGAVALYAALLDGNIKSLILRNPPGTQDMASNPDGTGPSIEMLNCLRITDIWQIPALIPETGIVFTGEVPSTYKWSEKVREKTGSMPFMILNNY